MPRQDWNEPKKDGDDNPGYNDKWLTIIAFLFSIIAVLLIPIGFVTNWDSRLSFMENLLLLGAHMEGDGHIEVQHKVERLDREAAIKRDEYHRRSKMIRENTQRLLDREQLESIKIREAADSISKKAADSTRN